MGDIIEVEVENTQQSGAVQTRTSYTTAMTVIRPRNLAMVEQRALQEAAIAGDEFYYSWRQKGSIIEGLTIGAANAIARNLGNCAVPVEVDETKEAYYFTATFIDLETGFNLQRKLRQRKTQNMGEKMKKDGRDEDIIFQIGQSKAIRNVILNGVPNWLCKKVLAKAKENVKGKIEQMGKEKAKDMLLKKANSLKILPETIEASFGKQAGWDTEKLVQISGALRGLEDGYISIEEAFPSQKVETNKSIANELKSENDVLSVLKNKLKTLGITDVDSFCKQFEITEENAGTMVDDEAGLQALVEKFNDESIGV